ncbi:MAG: T9SS type A sorting domain-containing protein [Syntrophomonadaceae bacterium]
MRLFATIMLLTVLSLSPVFAQIPIPLSERNTGGSYPIDGTHLLDKQEQMVADYLKKNPGAVSKMRLSKAAAWNFSVGSTKAWWSQDLTKSYPSSLYQVPSTCRKVGVNCYVFVEDDIWELRVNQTAVDQVAQYFDSKTPANAAKGIYQTDVEAFGSPADVDNDPKIVILIEDIKDGYNGSGGYVAGYFTGLNEVDMQGSNHAEIYYLDGNPGDLSTDAGLYQAVSTTAHEFQHMIFWNSHQGWQQSTFINEGCSMLAEINAGFSARGQGGQYGYNNETNYYLMGWRGVNEDKNLIDYSRASRFFLYLRDQFGMGIFKKIVNSSQFGFACFNDALQQMGSPLKLADVFTNFMMANIVDDRSVDQTYGYVYPNLPKPTGTVYANPNASASNGLHYLAGEYLTFNNGKNLNITFSSSGSSLKIKALENGPSGRRILDVPLNAPFSEPQFGTGYTTVTFAVINPTESDDNSSAVNYSYNSTGTVASAMELKWDDAEPVGLYKFATNDTVCVTFDAVKGGRLDSIRVALRRAGSIQGGVWEATGVSRPSPLGTKLASLTASTTLSPLTPYPVPWTNWRGVDLRQNNIKTDKPFAVGFIFGADASVPGIMFTKHAGGDPFHSYTYFTPQNSDPNWYYLQSGANGDSVTIYLIRAYVSFTTTQAAELKSLKPSNYSLSQNYPNPFNPVTTIRYQIPEAGFVTLKVYDMLGNEVRSLVERDMQAGEYTATFDGRDLASGIYFYKLTQGSFTGTKKLVLMK